MDATFFPGDARKERAATVLAMMTPEMVGDVVELARAEGNSLVTYLFSNTDGSTRPLAVLDRGFIDDRDFHHVAAGFRAILIAALRNVKGDAPYYSGVLTSAYQVPVTMANTLASRIETQNILKPASTASADAKQKVEDYLRRVLANSRVGFREIAGTAAEAFDTVADVDFLYEIKLLGAAAEELESMNRLMKPLSLQHQALKLLPEGIGASGRGEVFGDPSYDSDELALRIAEAVRPLAGNPLPESVMGGASKIGIVGKLASKLKLTELLKKFGGTDGDQVQKATNSPILQMSAEGMDPGTLAKVAELIADMQKMIAQGQGDIYGDVSMLYGEPVARAVADGNLIKAYRLIHENAADEAATTGFADTDTASDVAIGEVFGEVHDDEDLAFDQEIGGLFGNAAKRQARKANRQQKLAAKRAQKQADKDTAFQTTMANQARKSYYRNFQPQAQFAPVVRPPQQAMDFQTFQGTQPGYMPNPEFSPAMQQEFQPTDSFYQEAYPYAYPDEASMMLETDASGVDYPVW